MMKKYTCIIVDDDEIDRLTAVSYAKKFPVLDIIGIFESAEDAVPFLEKEKIDILFLDIDMPGLNGIEFRKQALEVPVCVFITAHPEHAVESFQIETLDFIVK
ncbi:MAG TPA: response regulator, partial [Flavobacterium sp.]|nr:response regulator [Flavobacterium sp.]